MANNYRCYFMDESDRIRSYERIESPDDSAAVLKVHELLVISIHNTAELWHGRQLVGRWSADSDDVRVDQNAFSRQSAHRWTLT